MSQKILNQVFVKEYNKCNFTVQLYNTNILIFICKNKSSFYSGEREPFYRSVSSVDINRFISSNKITSSLRNTENTRTWAAQV